MQIAISNQHMGFRPDACLYTVYLNDRKLDRCLLANDEKGIAICAKDDENATRYLVKGSIRIECP